MDAAEAAVAEGAVAEGTVMVGAVMDDDGTDDAERECAVGSMRPRKSPTLVSTNWLIEIPLVSQYALSRSYVTRLTLILRRVCFFAMRH